MLLQPVWAAGLLHTGTGRCGPAPSTGKPRKVFEPPEKNRSLVGTVLPPKPCAVPNSTRLAHTICFLIGTYIARWARSRVKLKFEPNERGATSRLIVWNIPLCAS